MHYSREKGHQVTFQMVITSIAENYPQFISLINKSHLYAISDNQLIYTHIWKVKKKV